MTIRKRNSLDKFIPLAYEAQKERFLQIDFLQNHINFYGVAFPFYGFSLVDPCAKIKNTQNVDSFNLQILWRAFHWRR